MTYLHQLLISQPLLALFLTIALGYFVGKFKVKRFVLGGIAGSLLVGVAIGQFGIKLPAGIGSIFFALFIYAVGYQGGPQFFRSLNRDTLVQLISATVTCLLGLCCVLIAAWIWKLDRGTAAGLAAGGLTQSAIIGTAGNAISNLNISAEMKHILQSNVAVGYAVCYIFGSFGPILMLASVFPAMMRWDLRHEAKQLAELQGGESAALEPGQFYALRAIDTRVYRVNSKSNYVGHKIMQVFDDNPSIAVEALVRDGKPVDLVESLVLEVGDLVALTATIDAFLSCGKLVGEEVIKPDTMALIEEKRDIILNKPEFDKKTIKQCFQEIEPEQHHGVFITAVSRFGEKITPHQGLQLHRGDEVQLLGRSSNLDKLSSKFGFQLSAAKLTDFIFFGLGMALGVVLGMVNFRLFGIEITLGAGVGCLFSGLLFGWLRSTHPRYANLPDGASNFLRDFGLAVFVASVGITAGPQAIETMKKYGLELFFLGVGVTLIPQVISFYFSYYILKIKNPIILLATIAGGRSANPGFAALLDKAGNSTPVIPFTATYAIANILLTLWGPLVIGLITINP